MAADALPPDAAAIALFFDVPNIAMLKVCHRAQYAVCIGAGRKQTEKAGERPATRLEISGLKQTPSVFVL